MTAFKVVLTDQVFPTVEIEREMLLAIDAEIEILDDPSHESIARGAADADALLTTYAAIDARLRESLARCRIIARYGIGVDTSTWTQLRNVESWSPIFPITA